MPESDFAAWRCLVGEDGNIPQVGSFAEYMTLLAAVQADLERSGHAVTRVKMTVAEMRQALTERGQTSTPDSRAAVLARRIDTSV